MSDDKSNRGPQDRNKINLHEDYEVRYWTGKFGVSHDRLRTAVNEVGSSAAAVERYLQQSASKS